MVSKKNGSVVGASKMLKTNIWAPSSWINANGRGKISEEKNMHEEHIFSRLVLKILLILFSFSDNTYPTSNDVMQLLSRLPLCDNSILLQQLSFWYQNTCILTILITQNLQALTLLLTWLLTASLTTVILIIHTINPPHPQNHRNRVLTLNS